MRIWWALATVLTMCTTGAFAQGSGRIDCTIILDNGLIYDPNRVAQLKTLLTEESGLLRQYYGLEERVDDAKYRGTYDDALDAKPLGCYTLYTSRVEDNCFRIDGYLGTELGTGSRTDFATTVTRNNSYDPLPVTIFVLAREESPFVAEYRKREIDLSAPLPHAFINDRGFQLLPSLGASSASGELPMPVDQFKISAHVNGRHNQTTLGNHGVWPNEPVPLPGEGHWFAFDLGKGLQLAALICEGSCKDFADTSDDLVVEIARPHKRPTVPAQSEVVVADLNVVANLDIVIHINGQDDLSVSWSGLDGEGLESVLTAVQQLHSNNEGHRRDAMEMLMGRQDFSTSDGLSHLNDSKSNEFTEEITFSPSFLEPTSKVVRRVELVLREPLVLSDPTTQSLLADCVFFADLSLGESPIGESMPIVLEASEAPNFDRLALDLPEELIAIQEEAATGGSITENDETDRTLRLVVYTSGWNGNIPSCELGGPTGLALNETRIRLWQEESTKNYSFDPETGVAQSGESHLKKIHHMESTFEEQIAGFCPYFI